MHFIIYFVIKDLTLYRFFGIRQNTQANLSEPGIFLGTVLGLIIVIFLPWLLSVLIFCFLVIFKHIFFLKTMLVKCAAFKGKKLFIMFSIYIWKSSASLWLFLLSRFCCFTFVLAFFSLCFFFPRVLPTVKSFQTNSFLLHF